MAKRYMNMKGSTEDWKELLFQDVFREPRPQDLPIPEDYEESVMYVLSTLKDKERDLILQRYKDKKTFKDCGDSIGVSGERARQIIMHGLRYLRHPTRSQIIMYGLKRAKEIDDEKCREEKEKMAAESLVYPNDISLTELELSTRSYNCLYRASLKTVGDIIDYIASGKSLLRIRNLGSKSAQEIFEALSTVGVVI